MLTMTINDLSTFQLRLRYGIRGIENFEMALAGLCSICIVGHAICLIGSSLVVVAMLTGLMNVIGPELWRFLGVGFVITMAFGTAMAVLFNRPTMYFALRMLAAVEATISGKRTRKARGWTGLFFDFFPFSVLVPPGDLLAVILLIMRTRSNTDHLEGRQATVFRWSELGIGVGSIMQYVAAVGTVGAMVIAGAVSTVVMIGIGIGLHAIMLVGVFSVVRSLHRMRLELVEFVQPARTDDDPESFLARLSQEHLIAGNVSQAIANLEETHKHRPRNSEISAE